jgi:MFS family permease
MKTAARQQGETVQKANGAVVGRNVTALGWVAFFGGFAQDMIQPILPTFYTSVLGLSKEYIGLIEGTLTTVVSLMRIAAGYLSDRLGIRKAIVFLGYALSAVGRGAFALAHTGVGALVVRSLDGIGKGMKDAPRDALVAGAASSKHLGYAFGVQRTLDTLGSVGGPLLAAWLLRIWASRPERYRDIFLIAGAIATIPLVIIGFFVRERTTSVKKQPLSLKPFRGKFAWFLLIMLAFSLGNSSDAFLILRAQDIGLAAAIVPVAYALFNLVSAVTAIPIGRLSDRIGRHKAILMGWGIYALSYLGFALAQQRWMVWALYALYGLYYACTEGAAKALVAEMVPEENRGAAYGLYNASIGIIALPASVIAGVLWTHVSRSAPFLFGAIMAALATAALLLLPWHSDRAQGIA